MDKRYVLMLENDIDDRYFTQSTLEELDLKVDIRYEYYSPSLLASLQEMPALILLAYSTDPDTGLLIVQECKSGRLKKIPLIVLIEDLPAEAIEKYYEAGVSTVIKKPASQQATEKKIEAFFRYWFEVADLQ